MSRQEARAVLMAHPYLRPMVFVPIEVPVQKLGGFPACARIKKFLADRDHSVQVYYLDTAMGRVDHLLVRRHDGSPIRDWGTLQAIKNAVAGENATAVEVFPAQRDLVDQANIYHLWVLPGVLPFGLHLPGGGM